MSAFVYPGPSELPGLTWDRVRTPMWATTIHEAWSGKESRIRRRQYPRIRFGLKYEILRDTVSPSEVRKLVGLFNALAGAHDTCLFVDPDFNAVTAESFGTGNGVQAAFQLVARYQNAGGPGAAEAIQNLNGTPQIYVAGVLQIGTYTLGPTGIVTFASAPSNGAALTWTGSFYYRVRFAEDDLEVTQFLSRWWQTGEVELVSVRL